MRCTFSDLDRVRLEVFLEGQADSRTEVIGCDLRGKTIEELREILHFEIAELRRPESSVEEASTIRRRNTGKRSSV
jgi:hypothetical protein